MSYVVVERKEIVVSMDWTEFDRRDLGVADVLTQYGKRWGIECSFRDIKDYKFSMGMADTHVRSTLRRDRLFLFSALAIMLLTLLGKRPVMPPDWSRR